MPIDASYCSYPTIQGNQIVFVCDDDLWSVSAEGGPARRLSANPGGVKRPILSPDGKRLAYASRDEGQWEIWTMPATGGRSERLTWLGSVALTAAWRPKGSTIVYLSDAHQPFAGQYHLYGIAPSGGPATPLNLGPAVALSFARKGAGLVIARNNGDPARWKRYRGGTAGTLWIDRTGKGRFQKLIDLPGNLASPHWIDGRIYFLSDHEGIGNLYSCSTRGQDLQRHTDHGEFYVRFPQSDGQRIVYSCGADLWLLDPATGENRKIEVEIHSARSQRNRKFVDAAHSLESFAIHPEGHSLSVISRGRPFRFPLWEEAAVQQGQADGVRYRLSQWLPDGKRLLAVSDGRGDEDLVLFSAAGVERRVVLKADLGRAVQMAVAPSGVDRVAITNHRHELLLVDLKTKTTKVIDRSRISPIAGLAWSPDGRWLAYGKSESSTTSAIQVYDTRRGRIQSLTRADFKDMNPAFDTEGKYLYFISYREFDPVYDNHIFDLGFPRGGRVMVLPLTADLPSPFDGIPRPIGTSTADLEGTNGKQKKAKDAPLKVKIDMAGITDRLLAVPVPEGNYSKVACVPGKVLYMGHPVAGSLDEGGFDQGAPAAKNSLEVYDLELQKQDTLVGGVSDFEVSPDGKTLVYRAGNRLRALAAGSKPDPANEGKGPGRESGWIDLGRLRISVDPAQEWQQMYTEAWRLMRDHFWTADMSGTDWDRIHDRYLPLLDRVACRSEFSDLLWEMQGELGTSHAYEIGGDYRPVPAYTQGHLGADLAFDKKAGVWRITRIPRGDSWLPGHTSALAAPGIRLAVGDRLLAIGGRKLDRSHPPGQRLVHLANQPVEITVAKADGTKKRKLVVRTLASEKALRYRDWVESNRAKVHKKTKGRVGYVHIPDMGPHGYGEFHRYFLAELQYESLIVDVRFNGGGHVSQLILEKLLRRRVGYDTQRWGDPQAYPSESLAGPIVALTNEMAGSDGDIFSHCFKLYGLGPLIGKRTWGGVVGIWPRHPLVDGTITTQPEFSFWFEDVGFGVENYGTDPDIEVEILPQHHAAGKDPQMDRALEEILKRLKDNPVVMPDLTKRPRLGLPKLPRRK